MNPRRLLDGLYTAGAVVAAFCLCAMLVVILLQMIARWTGLQFPGSAQYAGYLMAASSFLAFAQALNRGAHIRVTLIFNVLKGRKYWAELWALLIASAAACYLAYFSIRLV